MTPNLFKCSGDTSEKERPKKSDRGREGGGYSEWDASLLELLKLREESGNEVRGNEGDNMRGESGGEGEEV